MAGDQDLPDAFSLAEIVTNPFYAINIDPELAVVHEPLIDKEAWIVANVAVIAQVGAEQYLRDLLALLERPDQPEIELTRFFYELASVLQEHGVMSLGQLPEDVLLHWVERGEALGAFDDAEDAPSD